MTATDPQGEASRLVRARERFGLAAGPACIPLAGDIGARRYFRQTRPGGATVLVVLYPQAESPAQANWAAIAEAMARVGVRVPALEDDAPDLGAALIEDLGDRDLSMDLADAPREDRPRLLDEAEEQESRMTLLAYFCLWRYAGPEGWTAADLDASMELYIDRYAELALNCRPGEGVVRLEKLHLVEREGDHFRVVPLEKAAAALQDAWISNSVVGAAGNQERPKIVSAH